MRWMRAVLMPLAVVAGVVVGAFAVLLVHGFLDSRFKGYGVTPWHISAYAFVQFVVPLAVGSMTAWKLRKWWPWSVPLGGTPRQRRALRWAAGIGYVLTACCGSPMVESDLTEMVVSEYRRERRIDESGILPYHRVSPYYPSCRTFLSVPVLPGVLVVYHEYHASMLNGGGAFYVFFWYGVGVKYVTSFQTWVS